MGGAINRPGAVDPFHEESAVKKVWLATLYFKFNTLGVVQLGCHGNL